MASPNQTFTDLVTTTLRDHPNVIADNVSGKNALYKLMRKKKRLMKQADGYEIVEPISYGENGTHQRYSGYDALDISESNNLTAAKYDWTQAAINITASGLELRSNSGAKIIDLMKARTKVAMDTAANKMSLDLYSSGSLTNQIGGLAHIIQTAGTGTVGGIDSSTYTWWQNKIKEATGTGPSYTDLKQDMLTLWLECERGGDDKPDLILSTSDLYVVYWDQLSDNQRYSDTSEGDTLTTLKFQSANVIPDLNDNFASNGEKMFFLNTKYLALKYHPDANWTPMAQKSSVNQDAVVVPLLFQGQLCCSRRAAQGVLFDAA